MKKNIEIFHRFRKHMCLCYVRLKWKRYGQMRENVPYSLSLDLLFYFYSEGKSPNFQQPIFCFVFPLKYYGGTYCGMSLTYESIKVLTVSFSSQALIGMTNTYKKSGVSKYLKVNHSSRNIQADIFYCPKLFRIQ